MSDTDPQGDDLSNIDAEFAAQMQRDWDARARLNAPYFVDFGAWRSEEEVDAAGARHVQLLIQDIPQARLAAMDVLDIGCGIGRTLRPLAAGIRRGVGIDVSLEMLHRAAHRLKECPNVHLVHNDGLGGLPFPDGSFDLVYSCFVFEHVPRPITQRYLAESRRVLRPRGRLRFQFIVPVSPARVNSEVAEFFSVKPEGVEALSRGPTFEGEPIEAEAMRSFLAELGYRVDKMEGIGANNVGVMAVIPGGGD